MVRESVPEGYKETEVGVIPEDWEVKKLKYLSDMKSGENITSKSINEFGKYPCFGGNGLRGFTYSYTHNGEFALIGRQGALCGNVQYTTGNFFASEHAIVVTPNKETDIKWLFYMLVDMRLNQYSESSAQPGLSVAKVLELQVAVPLNKTEQKAIAAVLSDVDELIASMEKLIDKKEKIKQGTMQLLLTGKKRLPGFTGEWEVKRLGEVFRLLPTGTNSRNELIDEGDVKYIHYGDIHTKWGSTLDCSTAQIPYIEEKKVKNLPLLGEGDLVMVDASEDYEGLGKSVEVKSIGDQKIVAGLHTILLRGNKELATDGFKGYIQFTQIMKDSVRNIATGISVYGISKRNLQDIPIPLPPLPEQKAIAQILSDMDAEIESLQKKRDKYKLIKEGMMDKLLTGKVRLI